MNPKTIVVTGVSRGLGSAMAAGFARRGHTVWGCARSTSALVGLKQSLGDPHDFVAVNVASDGEVQRWAQTLLQRHAAPDLLINNAAIINRNAPLWEVPATEFDAVLSINISGTANVLRHFVPAMIQRGRGVIVNFSSGWGRSTDADVAPYCASKWAIEGLTQALAQELPVGMSAVALNPGIINTSMLQSCFGNSASGYPSAEAWAERAVPFLLGLSAKDNGRPLTVA